MGYGATGSVGSVLYGVWCNRKCRECSLVGYGATGSVGSVLYGVWCNRKCRECSLWGMVQQEV